MIRIISRKPDEQFVQFMLHVAGVDLSRQDLANPNKWFVCSCKDTTGMIVAGMAVEYLHDFDAFFTAAVIDPEALTRRLLRAIFATLFSRVTRLTATVSPDNYASKEGLRRLGFQYEGFLRRGLDGNIDAEVYGLLAEDCKYLPGYSGGTIAPTTAINRSVTH